MLIQTMEDGYVFIDKEGKRLYPDQPTIYAIKYFSRTDEEVISMHVDVDDFVSKLKITNTGFLGLTVNTKPESFAKAYKEDIIDRFYDFAGDNDIKPAQVDEVLRKDIVEFCDIFRRCRRGIFCSTVTHTFLRCVRSRESCVSIPVRCRCLREAADTAVFC